MTETKMNLVNNGNSLMLIFSDSNLSMHSGNSTNIDIQKSIIAMIDSESGELTILGKSAMHATDSVIL